MSADAELGLVYVPVEMPTGDYYGGNRPGDTLFADSLLALDVKTGKRKWHFQTVHHDLWDWDLPCAPMLFDMTVNGRTVKAHRAADEAGDALRLQSRDRRADLADRRAARAAVGRAEGADEPDAAVPHEARAVRSARHHRERSDRSDAGAQGRGARSGQALQDGADLHAAGRELARRPASDAAGAVRGRRRQLAGRVDRPGQQLPLHPLAHDGVSPTAWCLPTPGQSDMALRRRDRRGRAARRAQARALPAGAAAAARPRRRQRAGPAAAQAAVRSDHRLRHEHRRDRLAEAAQLDARRHPESPCAQGRDRCRRARASPAARSSAC